MERFESGFFWRKIVASETNPATTGASAVGICGSLAFAQCDSPFTTYRCIDVCNPAWTWAAVPENSMVVRPLETLMDWKPKDASHEVTA